MKQVLLAITMVTSFFSSDKPSTVDGYASLSNYRYNGKSSIGKLVNGQYDQVRILSGQEFFTWKKNTLELTGKGREQIKQKHELTVQLSYNRNGKAEQKEFRILDDAFHKNPVIAHRGAWKQLPTTENSIAALEHAILLGCAGSELDVQMTKDDSLVVNHDADFNGKIIEDYTYAELAATPLSNGELLPTLRSYLQAGMKQFGTQLIVEIKPTHKGADRTKTRATEVVKLVHELGAQAWVSYISFDYDMLLRVKELDPSAHSQFLNGNKSPDELKKDGIAGLDYHYSVFQKNEDWISQAKKNKMVLNAWTVNDEKTLKYFLQQQFPMITTNEPELLFQVLKASSSASQ